ERVNRRGRRRFMCIQLDGGLMQSNSLSTRITRAHHGRPAFTLIELLVVIAIIGVLMALLLPAVQKVREAADKARCQNNLKQLALAMHTYHNAVETLPEGFSHPINPQNNWQDCYGTWMVLILPYVEQGNLSPHYHNYGNAAHTLVRFDDPTNLQVTASNISLFKCPSDETGKPINTSKNNYLVNFGNTVL